MLKIIRVLIGWSYPNIVLYRIRMEKVQHENKDRRPSPMLIKLANNIEKWNVLKNAKKLKYAAEEVFWRAEYAV